MRPELGRSLEEDMATHLSILAQRITWTGEPVGRKAMIKLGSILKSRDIILPTNVHLVKAMAFPVVIMDVRVGL